MTFLSIRQLVRMNFSIHPSARTRMTFLIHQPVRMIFLIRPLVRTNFAIRQLVRTNFSIRQLVRMIFLIRQLVRIVPVICLESFSQLLDEVHTTFSDERLVSIAGP